MLRFAASVRASAAILAVLAAGLSTAFAERRDKENTPLLALPLEFHEDMPYLKVRVNGSEPVWFVLDSGASACVVDKGHCKDFGVTIEGGRKGVGAGAGTVDFLFAKDVRYDVGELSLKVEQSYAIDLSGIATPKDKKLAGLLGYDFLQRYVVVIDYQKALLSVYDPKTYSYRGKDDSLPLTFKKKLPWVKGTIQVPGNRPTADREWLVDTGSGDTVNDELFARSTGQKQEITGGKGLGQEFRIVQATADRVDLGRYHFSQMAGVSGGMKIGSGLLRHFTVIFDYPKERMILEPNERYRE
jgi:hypothetical protein